MNMFQVSYVLLGSFLWFAALSVPLTAAIDRGRCLISKNDRFTSSAWLIWWDFLSLNCWHTTRRSILLTTLDPYDIFRCRVLPLAQNFMTLYEAIPAIAFRLDRIVYLSWSSLRILYFSFLVRLKGITQPCRLEKSLHFFFELIFVTISNRASP